METNCAHVRSVKRKTTKTWQCDKCDKWYHFKCVGVTASIENHDWECAKCLKIPAKPESIRSAVSSKQRIINLELQRLEEEKALETRFLNRKYEILAKSEIDGGSVRSHTISRTKQWLEKIENFSVDSEKITKVDNWSKPLESDQRELYTLTNGHIAARKALSTDLPTFSGKPEEWPLFYSAFVESTKLCGYSHSENLLRLQKSLKGKALEAVSSHIMLPQNVPEVIRTLKLLFGRPEIIMNTLLQKLRMECAPKSDNLDSLINYAISVRNLCSTLEASGLESHKNNPMLLQELVGKLPSQIKLNWALYISHDNADISKFSKWLFDIAEAVAKVNPMQTMNKAGSNIHIHEKEPTKCDETPCIICGKNHTIEKCTTFLEMKLSDRWDKVHQLKLCRLCLHKHGYYRCSDNKCPYEGCNARHHKLLHKCISFPTVTTHSNSTIENKTYFKIVPVILHNKDTSVKIFAFLDDGSNATLLQRDICDQLGLEGEAKNLCLKWTSETSRVEEDSLQVDVFISGCKEMSKKYELSNIRTVKNLSLPMQNVLKQDLESYPYLRNIPITTYSNASPKILIGLNNSYVCNSLKTIEGNRNEPSVTKTRLGWVIHGGNEVSMEKTVGFHNKEYCHCDDEIEKLQRVVSEYMSLENVGCKYELVSEEEKRAIQILEKTLIL
ncbi:uncharacterized protein LOC142229903 [Haematobia irritans]|uniref:uncharacterized protein LOC142229903 n=1 Tax=Haematobia irritans TaxID=7368 RepID=UPI003F4F6EF1